MTKTESEKRLQHFMYLRQEGAKNTINEQMDFECIRFYKKEVVLRFPVRTWQLNPMGKMHGGMIATAFDITMGCISYILSDADHTPTISMDIQYVRAVKPNEYLYVKATALHVGKRLVQVQAIAYQKEGEICASSHAGYIINAKNIVKE